MTNPIVSLSIAARMTLNMHSLNNEGGEGNQISDPDDRCGERGSTTA